MAKGKRKVPGINASSTADISFILLIFFLVVTSMNSQEGLHVTLPRKDKIKDEKIPEIEKQDILQVLINSNDEIRIVAGNMTDRDLENKFNLSEGSASKMKVEDLRKIVKAFIKNEEKMPAFPKVYNASLVYTEFDEKTGQEKAKHTLPGGKSYDYTKDHVITLTTDRETSYSIYFKVANELYGAYNDLRDEMALEEYGKSYSELNSNQRGVVSEYYKYKVFEAKPIDGSSY